MSKNSEVLASDEKCSLVNVVSMKEESYKRKFLIKVESFRKSVVRLIKILTALRKRDTSVTH